MFIPQIVNIDTAYKHDGMLAFSLELTTDPVLPAIAEPIDLSGMLIEIPITNSLKQEVWKFSTDGEGDKLIIATADGKLLFPQINEWQLEPGKYKGDVKVTDVNGLALTYLIIQFTRINTGKTP